MFDFEKLHPNHKFAFIDGLLTGVVVTVVVRQFWNDYQEMKEYDRKVEKFLNDSPTDSE